MAALEEATRCPKCGQQGKEHSRHNGPRGSTVFVIHCQNEVCPWYSTGWTVQKLANGEVAEREKGMKEFPELSVYDKAAAEKILNDVKDIPGSDAHKEIRRWY